MDKVFSALASTPRRRILAYLSATSLTAGEIADRFEMSKPSLSKHLSVLENAGLFRWHSVEGRVRRSSWVFDVHWTAVIRDVSTFEDFAVDSWFLANGRAPYVQTLTEWFDKRPLPRNPDSELTGDG